MRIIFCGTPEFSAYHLKGLLDKNIQPIAVFTQPDRPSGRGQKLTPCPTKLLAQDAAIPVYQPENLKNESAVQLFRELQADVMIVVAYGLIIPKTILTLPKWGCINVHASLLPRWRGAAPIQRAIEAGDTETGVTIMQMDEGLDTGDILEKYPCPITANDNGKTLAEKLITLGIQGLSSVLHKLQHSSLTSTKQPQLGVTYAHKITKEETQINWALPAIQIDRQIRAWQPHLAAKTIHQGEVIKIHEAHVGLTNTDSQPGTVIGINSSITVQCGEGSLNVSILQKAGGKAISASQFLHGHPLTVGEVLGR